MSVGVIRCDLAPQDFGWAIQKLKQGRRVARNGWNGKAMWLQLVEGPEWACTASNREGMALLPFIGMRTAQGDFVPWLASQTDMLAEDWATVEPVAC